MSGEHIQQKHHIKKNIEQHKNSVHLRVINSPNKLIMQKKNLKHRNIETSKQQ